MSEKKVCWRVTRYCNLHCSHCLAGHGNAVRRDLTSAERINAINDIISAGVKRITWTGGEPTLCDDLPGLLMVCHRNEVKSVITTHGLTLRKNVLSSLHPNMDRLRVSFDGLERSHNMVRGGPFFSRTMAAVARCRDLHLVVEANVSVLASNVEEIPELLSLLSEAGISKVVFLTLLARESAVDNRIEPPSTDQMTKLFEAMKRFSQSNSHLELQFNNYNIYSDSYIVIESDGEIMLCSEINEDRSFGTLIGEAGTRNLKEALHHQTLTHRKAGSDL